MSETKEIMLVEREAKTALETNIDELEKFVAEKLTEYTPENYTGDADAAKKDRAVLNTSKKTISSRRIEIIKRAMERFKIDVFESRCKAVEKDIDKAASALDEIVKLKEAEEKRVKKEQIKQFWECQNFDLVPFDRVFNEKWLNKTAKNKDIFAEIEKIVADIYAGLKTIEQFGVDVETLKPIFLETLDLSATIERGNRIRENRERLEKEAAERAEREQTAQLRKQQEELAKEEVKNQQQSPAATLAQQAAGEPVDDDPEMTYTLRFKAKKSVLFALRQYMIDNKIEYEKLED